LRIGIIDLVARGPSPSMFLRLMGANLASIMPQVVGVWCRQEGHDVTLVCYSGAGDLLRALPNDVDVVFVGAFTESAQAAYALSNFHRSRGVVTVLGGPHARCYPEDAARYFDFVLGFVDREVVREILHDPAPQQPLGRRLSAREQPHELPGVRERWEFIEPV